MDLRRRYEALYQEALALKTAGHAGEAEAIELQAAALFQDLERYAGEHPNDLQTADYLLFLAERQWAIEGEDPDVSAHIERALSIRERALGPTDPAVAEALAKRAELHFLAGRWGEAEPLYRRAITIYDQSAPAPPALLAQCQGGLAQCLSWLGRAGEADPHFIPAIAFHAGPEGDKRILYFLLIYRAQGLETLGRREEAQALRDQAEALLPKNNPGEQGFQV